MCNLFLYLFWGIFRFTLTIGALVQASRKPSRSSLKGFSLTAAFRAQRPAPPPPQPRAPFRGTRPSEEHLEIHLSGSGTPTFISHHEPKPRPKQLWWVMWIFSIMLWSLDGRGTFWIHIFLCETEVMRFAMTAMSVYLYVCFVFVCVGIIWICLCCILTNLRLAHNSEGTGDVCVLLIKNDNEQNWPVPKVTQQV